MISVPSKIEYEIEIEKHQHDFLISKSKFTLMSGGYGSGKSFAMILKGIFYGNAYPGIRIIMCAEVFPLIRDTLHKDFESVCPRRLIKHATKLPLNIYFKNGSEFYFRSFDKEWKPKSFTVGAIFVEELTTFKQSTFQQLRGRLRQTSPSGARPYPRTLDAATNPGPPSHWVYKTFIDPHSKTHLKNSKVIYSTSFDNTFNAEDYLDDLRSFKTTNPDYYDRNVLGEWKRLSDLIYNLPDNQRQIPENIQFDYFIAGLDFGFGHPTSLSVIGYASGRYVVVDEWFRRKADANDIVEAIKEFHSEIETYDGQSGYDFKTIYCDGARPEIIETMTRESLPAVAARKGPGSVDTGILFMQGLINTGNYFISPRASYHLREIDSYTRRTIINVAGEIKEVPLKIGDDTCDSSRYACHTHHLENDVDIPLDDILEFQLGL